MNFPPYQDPPLPSDSLTAEDMVDFAPPVEEMQMEPLPPTSTETPVQPRQSQGLSFNFDGLVQRLQTDGFESLSPAEQELLYFRKANRDLAMSPEEMAKFVLSHEEKLRASSSPEAQLDMAKKQADLAASQKGKPLTSTEVNDLTQLKSVEFSLDELEKKLNAIPVDKRGPVAGRFAGANPYDADTQEIQNIVTSVVPGLARGVFGEVGVLTDADVKRYTNLLPNHTVPPEVAKRNLTNLRAKLRDSKIQKIETMQKAGMDVSGFMDDYNKLMQETTDQASDPFTPGKRYKDAAGNVRTYKGNGAWE
jgi:hypothetical protein